MDAIQGLSTEAFTHVDKLRIGQSYRLLRDLRLPICRSIMKALLHDGPMSVTDIISIVSLMSGIDIEQSVISRHLALLRRHHIITFELVQTTHIYTIDADRIQRINRAMDHFFSHER